MTQKECKAIFMEICERIVFSKSNFYILIAVGEILESYTKSTKTIKKGERK